MRLFFFDPSGRCDHASPLFQRKDTRKNIDQWRTKHHNTQNQTNKQTNKPNKQTNQTNKQTNKQTKKEEKKKKKKKKKREKEKNEQTNKQTNKQTTNSCRHKWGSFEQPSTSQGQSSILVKRHASAHKQTKARWSGKQVSQPGQLVNLLAQ